MPVAKPLTPVEIGSPVQFVSVPDVGVPNNGVIREGEVPNTAAPVPVSSVRAAARFADVGVARNVPTPVPSPVMPATGAAVAVIVPDPETAKLAPVPTTIAAVVFVLEVKALKAEPLPGFCHVAVVPLVAVRTCPLVGAVAARVLTNVVAEFNPLAEVALIVPEPEIVIEAPVPTTIAALAFVPEVIELKAELPAEGVCQVAAVPLVAVKI